MLITCIHRLKCHFSFLLSPSSVSSPFLRTVEERERETAPIEGRIIAGMRGIWIAFQVSRTTSLYIWVVEDGFSFLLLKFGSTHIFVGPSLSSHVRGRKYWQEACCDGAWRWERRWRFDVLKWLERKSRFLSRFTWRTKVSIQTCQSDVSLADEWWTWVSDLTAPHYPSFIFTCRT